MKSNLHPLLMLCVLGLSMLFVACTDPEEEPTALFTFVQKGTTVTFTNTSRYANSYFWDFGDSETSKEMNPTHTYNKAGDFTVVLIATNITKKNRYSQTITISQTEFPPTAEFTYKTEHPLKVVLTNTSSNATSYEWNFGDGKTSTDKNPIHRYDGIGVYKIKLTAKNGKKSATYTTNVEIKAPTNCYMTGFDINKIPTNNKYYQVQLTDDYAFSKTTYFWTTWFLLSSANLPYSYNFSSAETMNIQNEYVIRLYKYTGTGNPGETQAAGKGDWSALISPTSLQKYPETLTYSNSAAEIKLFFSWK